MADEDRARKVAIGERMARARIGSGYSNVTTFAPLMGVDRNTIGRWERGENAPSALQLETFTRLTRVSSDWILRGDAAPDARATLDAFIAKHGKRGERARTFLESIRLDGYTASEQFYELVLIAFESGLTADDAARVSRITSTAKAI